MNWLVDVKQKHLSLTSCQQVSLSQVNHPSAVYEEEQLHSLHSRSLLHACVQFSVLGDWIDLVLDVLAFEQLLHG